MQPCMLVGVFTLQAYGFCSVLQCQGQGQSHSHSVIRQEESVPLITAVQVCGPLWTEVHDLHMTVTALSTFREEEHWVQAHRWSWRVACS